MACLRDQWPQFTVAVLWLLWERWLGRTKKVKANSTLDLVATIGVAIVVAVIRNRRGKDGQSF